MVGPPTDIKPARLFRLLCQTPRPFVRLGASFGFAPDIQLYCRALHPREWAEWEDGEDDLETVVLQYALCDETGQPVLDRESVFLLTEAERSILSKVLETLRRIGPSHHGPASLACDSDDWTATLERGAMENPSILRSLGTVVEVAGDRYVPAPERHFNIPRSELLDGHWLAYRAARAVVERHAKTKR